MGSDQVRPVKSDVYVRPVSFQVWLACVYDLSGGGVQVLNHDRPGILPNKMVTV